MAFPNMRQFIGVVLPAAGRLVESIGVPVSQGFELTLDEINTEKPAGMKIKLITENDQSTVEGAVAAFNKMIQQDGESVILGPVTSAHAR